MKKAVLAASLLAAVILLALFFVSDRPEFVASSPTREGQVGEPSAGLQPPFADGSPLEAPEPVEVSPAKEPVVSTVPEIGAPERITLAGTITLLDEQGVEHVSEDGTFDLVLLAGDSGFSQEVAVTGGRWNTVIPKRTEDGRIDSLGVDGIVLGERSAFMVEGPFYRFPIPADRFLALRVRRSAHVLLHVQDRESGRELDTIELFDATHSRESNDHPGIVEASAILHVGSSPIPLTPDGDGFRRNYCARSPGYAWGRIEVDLMKGGERLLQLDPGGDLEVSIIGGERDPGTFLRVYRQDGRWERVVYESELGDMELVSIESLPAGRCAVRAEIGYWFREPVIVGKTEASIVPRGHVEITLALKAPETVPFVPLEGILVLPTEWEQDDFSISAKLLGTALGGMEDHLTISEWEMTALDPGVYRWTAGLD